MAQNLFQKYPVLFLVGGFLTISFGLQVASGKFQKDQAVTQQLQDMRKQNVAEELAHNFQEEHKQVIAEDSKASQKAAEDLFFSGEVIVQAVDRKTHLNNFTIGSVVVDPASITRHNPGGTPIADAYVASQSGTVYLTDTNGSPNLTIGNSAKIRNSVVQKGHQSASDQMTQQANKH